MKSAMLDLVELLFRCLLAPVTEVGGRIEREPGRRSVAGRPNLLLR